MLAAAVTVAALVLSGCEVRRRAAPVGVGFLRVAEVVRATDRAALSPLAWSPDGRRFAYGGRDGVWIHRLGDAAGAKIVTGEAVTAVAWSAATDTLAYIDRGVLWTIRPDGGNHRKIPIQGVVSRPVWAPGGDRLAVAVQPAGQGAVGAQVWWTSPDGTVIRQILWDSRGKRIGALGWFPDALYLFVGLVAADGDATVEWWKVRIAYPDFRRLADPPRPALHPVLSPSGEWIAFVVGETGRERAYAVRPDGTGLHPVSAPAARVTGLAWSRDGDKLAYGLSAGDTQAEIHVAAVSGAPSHLVASHRPESAGPGAGVSVAWAPDDAHLAYGTNTGTTAGAIWLVRFAQR